MGPHVNTLVLQAVFVLLASGWRSTAQWRATGSTGFAVTWSSPLDRIRQGARREATQVPPSPRRESGHVQPCR